MRETKNRLENINNLTSSLCGKRGIIPIKIEINAPIKIYKFILFVTRKNTNESLSLMRTVVV